MRDPDGTHFIEDNYFIRQLYVNLPDDHFLRSACAKDLVDHGYLIPFEIQGLKIIHPLIDFVTYPHEWCDAQLIEAANLTLNISKKIFEYGYELKDASAWNVIFDNGKPVFCDHLSFQKIHKSQWWAMGQFIRHFITPLSISKFKNINVADLFLVYRDGVDLSLTKNLIGPRWILSRAFMLFIKIPDFNKKKYGKAINSKKYHVGVYEYLSWLLNGLTPLKKDISNEWVNYTNDRLHYNDNASKKRDMVSSWIKELHPQWVIDLGCNTGEFTLLAHKLGAKVISIDSDEASIRKLYYYINGSTIHPILAKIDDLYSGRGWCGTEFSGLLSRLTKKVDTLLMLGLIHHIAITSSIPLYEIAKFASLLTNKYLIIELIDHRDSMLCELSLRHDRDPNYFTIENQLNAFENFFVVLNKCEVSNTRQLALCRLKYA